MSLFIYLLYCSYPYICLFCWALGHCGLLEPISAVMSMKVGWHPEHVGNSSQGHSQQQEQRHVFDSTLYAIVINTVAFLKRSWKNWRWKRVFFFCMKLHYRQLIFSTGWFIVLYLKKLEKLFMPPSSNLEPEFSSRWVEPLLCINWQIVKITVSWETANIKENNVPGFVPSLTETLSRATWWRELASLMFLFRGHRLVWGLLWLGTSIAQS